LKLRLHNKLYFWLTGCWITLLNIQIANLISIYQISLKVSNWQKSFNSNLEFLPNPGLLGRFAPIFYFHFEHVLIVTLKNKEKKFRGFYKKKYANFQDFKFSYKNKKKL